MRTTVFLLAFILLALSFLPCADGGYARKVSKAKTEIVKLPVEKSNGSDNDLCPPFCHCGCCAGVSINTCFVSVEALQMAYLLKIPSYLPGNTIEVSLPIWQPPQLIS
jgi:hypothetical protein